MLQKKPLTEMQQEQVCKVLDMLITYDAQQTQENINDLFANYLSSNTLTGKEVSDMLTYRDTVLQCMNALYALNDADVITGLLPE